MKTSRWDAGWKRRIRNLVLLTVAVVVGFLLLVVVETAAPAAELESGMSEATASLLAAVAAVGVPLLSHRRGRRRRARLGEDRHRVLLEKGEGIELLVASVVLVLAAFLTADWAHISTAAGAALAGAIISFTLTDALHDLFPVLRGSRSVGISVIITSLAVGFACVLCRPGDAEAVAAIGAAVLTFGGGLLGHAEGYSTATRRDNRRMDDPGDPRVAGAAPSLIRGSGRGPGAKGVPPSTRLVEPREAP
jgi:hypothetical protein